MITRLHQKSSHKRNLPQLVTLLGIVLCVGATLASLAMSDDKWMDWSFSSLGEAQAPSALIFNTSLVIAGGIMWLIGGALLRNFRQLNILSAAKLSSYTFKILAICLMGLALFPNDTHHGVHVIFGRSLIVVFSAYVILLPRTLPYLSWRDKLVSYGVLVLAGLLTFQGYFTKTLSFVLFEILLGCLALGWIYLLCLSVTRRAATQSVEI